MTENEAIDKLNNLHYKILHSSFSSMVYVSEIEALCMAKDCLKEIQQYRAIGTVEEFKDLKEKSVAKKQGNINDFDSHLKLSKAGFLCCSSTNKDIRYPLISLSDLDYCPRCGQKLDW